jgi:uncharacterized protein (TIGR01619 family)
VSSTDTAHWDFYPCVIEDAPASILLDLRFEREERPAGATTLYRMRVQMLEPEDHGMGSAAETAAINALEEQLVARATEGELTYVGRVRAAGLWELVFYGPPERGAVLQAMRELITDRRTYLDVRPDAEWGFYTEFLLPDAERRQWMADRRIIDVLREKGDALATPRSVEHWLYFATAEDRDRFTAAAKELGFAIDDTEERDDAPSFVVQLSRDDSVELDHIHDVVMQLHELAAAHGGDYDGWETPVVFEFKPPAS